MWKDELLYVRTCWMREKGGHITKHRLASKKELNDISSFLTLKGRVEWAINNFYRDLEIKEIPSCWPQSLPSWALNSKQDMV